MLLGIWSEKDSAGHKILASLSFDDEKAKELSKNVSFEVLLFLLSNSFIFVTLMIDLQNSNYLILVPCRWTRIMLWTINRPQRYQISSWKKAMFFCSRWNLLWQFSKDILRKLPKRVYFRIRYQMPSSLYLDKSTLQFTVGGGCEIQHFLHQAQIRLLFVAS